MLNYFLKNNLKYTIYIFIMLDINFNYKHIDKQKQKQYFNTIKKL